MSLAVKFSPLDQIYIVLIHVHLYIITKHNQKDPKFSRNTKKIEICYNIVHPKNNISTILSLLSKWMSLKEV